MPQIADQIYYWWGGMRLSNVARPLENQADERPGVNASNSESKRLIEVPGRAQGGVDIPLYDVTGPTAQMLANYDGGSDYGLIITPVPTADTLAFVYRAHAMGMRHWRDEDTVALKTLPLKFAGGGIEAQGLNMYTQVGGVGVTAPANGSSITFPALAATESLLVVAAFYAVTSTGNLDCSIVSAPDDTYAAPTTQHTFTQVAHTAVPTEQYALINGAVTDPEWRFEIDTVSGGTWFIHVAAVVITEL